MVNSVSAWEGNLGFFVYGFNGNQADDSVMFAAWIGPGRTTGRNAVL